MVCCNKKSSRLSRFIMILSADFTIGPRRDFCQFQTIFAAGEPYQYLGIYSDFISYKLASCLIKLKVKGFSPEESYVQGESSRCHSLRVLGLIQGFIPWYDGGSSSSFISNSFFSSDLGGGLSKIGLVNTGSSISVGSSSCYTSTTLVAIFLFFFFLSELPV